MAQSNCSSTTASIRWQWSAFAELSGEELYAVLTLRQEVFIVEQACRYRDIDNTDCDGWHLLGWDTNVELGLDAATRTKPELVAYLRCFPPGLKFAECAVGRVVVVPLSRGRGIGTALMQEGLRRVAVQFPAEPVRIGAQEHLQDFYKALGFVTVSESYLEDGIAHVEMLRPADACGSAVL